MCEDCVKAILEGLDKLTPSINSVQEYSMDDNIVRQLELRDNDPVSMSAAKLIRSLQANAHCCRKV